MQLYRKKTNALMSFLDYFGITITRRHKLNAGQPLFKDASASI